MDSALFDEIGHDSAPEGDTAHHRMAQMLGPQRRIVSILMPMLKQGLQLLGTPRLLKRQPKRLRLTENLSLGEKRFVAIVEVDGTSLLIGGGSAGVVLLKQLDPAPETAPCFETVMQAAVVKEFG